MGNVQDNQIVLFQIDNQEYGIRINMVEGINHLKDFTITKLPNTEGYIEGIINLRGNVIPLYNLRKKFGFDETEIDKESEILVVSSKNLKIGFIVDIVTDIIRLEQEKIHSASKLFNQVGDEYIEGIGQYGNKMLVVLNTEKILTLEERKDIEPLVEDEK